MARKLNQYCILQRNTLVSNVFYLLLFTLLIFWAKRRLLRVVSRSVEPI